jgi:UDP-2,4-diacetamido-2,4,6-trideoxy-beta-L-altropyranose hydrolase
MRCLALAELLQLQGWRCRFAYAECPQSLLARLQRAGMQPLALPSRHSWQEIQALAPQLLVWDGYHFPADYRRRLRPLAQRVLALDDGQDESPLYADGVLNSSPLACAADYAQRAPGARLLLGVEYAPLRQEFLRLARGSARPQEQRLLVSLGGSDVLNLGPGLVQALLQREPGLSIDWAVGAASGQVEAAQQLARQHGQRLRLYRDCTQMAQLMAQARMALAAAGSTLLELAYLGLPGLALVVADNQQPALAAPYNQWFSSWDLRNPEGRQAQLQRLCGQALEQLQDRAGLQRQRQRLLDLPIASRTEHLGRELMSAAKVSI